MILICIGVPIFFFLGILLGFFIGSKYYLVTKTCKSRRCVSCEAGANGQCNLTGSVYQIKCRICTKFYIGQSSRRLKVRFSEHCRSLRKQNFQSAIGQHFAQDHSEKTAKNISELLSVTILHSTQSSTERIYFEAKFINHLQPELNRTS